MITDHEILRSAIALVAADQRLSGEEWTDAEAVAYLRHVVVPWDSEPVMGAVRADYIVSNPTSLAVDMVLRADPEQLEQVLPGFTAATLALTGQ